MTNWKHNLIGFIVSFSCIAFIVFQIDFVQIRLAISNFIPAYLILGVLALIFGYIFRILRWSILLNASGANTSYIECIAPFMGSIALNNVLPMRTGDIFRAVIFPTFIGVRKTVSTSSIIMERIFDLVTLVLFLLVGFSLNNGEQIPSEIRIFSLTLLVLSLIVILIFFLYSKSISNWIYRSVRKKNEIKVSLKFKFLIIVADILKSFNHMSRPLVLFFIGALSIMIWVGEAGVFYALILGFNFSSSIEIAMIVMSIATLSTLLPSSPGYIGPFHLAAFTAISMFGFNEDQSASFALLSHLLIWLPTTIVGAILIFFNPELFKFKKNL